MRTRSGSLRWLTNFDCPGRRRSRSTWISASVSAMPGGQPSITQPIAGPCDSPKFVTVKSVPKVLPDMCVVLLQLSGETDIMPAALFARAAQRAHELLQMLGRGVGGIE